MIRSSSARTLALVGALLIAAPASAQPGTSTADAARALYVEGKELRRAGDLQGSLEKLDAAHALYATPITALEVGRGCALVGRYRRAVEVLASIDRLPVKPNESEKAADARAEAKTLLAQYGARLGRLTLRIDGDGGRVRVDGDVVPSEAVSAAWLVDPGLHHVELSRDEQRVAEDVRVGEGEERVVTLHLAAPAPPPGAATSSPAIPIASAPPPAPLAPRAEPPPHQLREAGTSPLAYVGLGVGAVGLATGMVTGLVTLSRASTLKAGECPNGACPSSAGLDGTKTLGNVSTAAFVVGGAGIAVGLGALFFGSRSASIGTRAEAMAARRSAWVRPFLGGPFAGLRGGFR